MELRLGDFREVLSDVKCNAVITDPPYSARTHDKQCTKRNDSTVPQPIEYTAWGSHDVEEAAKAFAAMSQGWVCAMSDSVLLNAWSDALAASNLTTFAPLPCVINAMTVRLNGDGPSSWAVYLNVARPKALSQWGTLQGAYVGNRERQHHVGGKPLWLMRNIVRDYSRRGDLVCDPCAGAGTTLLAAAIEGRRAIGAEVDPETFEKAVARLSQPYTQTMEPMEHAPREQKTLFDDYGVDGEVGRVPDAINHADDAAVADLDPDSAGDGDLDVEITYGSLVECDSGFCEYPICTWRKENPKCPHRKY